MDDSALYTGVDNPTGVFGNEIVNEDVAEQIKEQKKQLQELTPKLQDIITMLDAEIKIADSIDHFGDATDHPETDIRAELRASFLYKQKLENLKTKFALALGETKR